MHIRIIRAYLLKGLCDGPAGQLRVLPCAAESLNKGARITACSLYRDEGRMLVAADSSSSSSEQTAPVLCLICRSDSLDMYSLPDMAPLLSFSIVPDGATLLGSSAGVTAPHRPLFWTIFQATNPILFMRNLVANDHFMMMTLSTFKITTS